MAGKQTGLGWTGLNVDNAAGVAKDIRNDVTNFSFATPRALLDSTGIDKSANERLPGLADFSIDLSGIPNFDADKSHSVLKTVPSSSVIRTVGLEISSQTLNNECLFANYDWTRGNDGALTWQATASLADGTVPTWS
ncbi:hypothetical protein [Lentzea sp. NPDC092896]|uniref:hypothetical protein n=1 Tax=Lentzea sp. NPDC092896 TaxID=3364127 RepID=UPI0038271968